MVWNVLSKKFVNENCDILKRLGTLVTILPKYSSYMSLSLRYDLKSPIWSWTSYSYISGHYTKGKLIVHLACMRILLGEWTKFYSYTHYCDILLICEWLWVTLMWWGCMFNEGLVNYMISWMSNMQKFAKICRVDSWG